MGSEYCPRLLLHLLRLSYIFSSLISRYGELHCFFSVELALYFFDNPQSCCIFTYCWVQFSTESFLFLYLSINVPLKNSWSYV